MKEQKGSISYRVAYWGTVAAMFGVPTALLAVALYLGAWP